MGVHTKAPDEMVMLRPYRLRGTLTCTVMLGITSYWNRTLVSYSYFLSPRFTRLLILSTLIVTRLIHDIYQLHKFMYGIFPHYCTPPFLTFLQLETAEFLISRQLCSDATVYL